MTDLGQLHIISLGAGVQSSTMALMATHGEITPMPDCAIFADTQAEPRAVYEWLHWLERQLPFPVYRVSRPGASLTSKEVELHCSKKTGNIYRKQMIPAFAGTGMLPRKCTVEFKIEPIQRKLRELAAPWRGCSVPLVSEWIGISTDEASRMKDSRLGWVVHRYPVIEAGFSRDDCRRWMTAHDYPDPPRSACTFCPYHSDLEWRSLTEDEFGEAVRFERAMQEASAQTVAKEIPYLHRSRQPLAWVKFDANEDKGFENECEGMCGV